MTPTATVDAISSRKHRLLRLLWVGWAVVVIAGSLLPASSTPIQLLERLHISDKLLHLFAYALLGFIPALHESRLATLLQVSAAILIGILLEFGQTLSVGRSFEIRDMVADTSGALLGVLLGRIVRG